MLPTLVRTTPSMAMYSTYNRCPLHWYVPLHQWPCTPYTRTYHSINGHVQHIQQMAPTLVRTTPSMAMYNTYNRCSLHSYVPLHQWPCTAHTTDAPYTRTYHSINGHVQHIQQMPPTLVRTTPSMAMYSTYNRCPLHSYVPLHQWPCTAHTTDAPYTRTYHSINGHVQHIQQMPPTLVRTTPSMAMYSTYNRCPLHSYVPLHQWPCTAHTTDAPYTRTYHSINGHVQHIQQMLPTLVRTTPSMAMYSTYNRCSLHWYVPLHQWPCTPYTCTYHSINGHVQHSARPHNVEDAINVLKYGHHHLIFILWGCPEKTHTSLIKLPL